MPFKITGNTSFSIAFVASCINLISNVATQTGIQLIFLDLCIHIMACYKDVQRMYGKLDDIVEVSMTKELKNAMLMDSLHRTVKFHQQAFM